MNKLSRQAFAEYLGTTLLLAAVVGSGIMGTRLSGGNDGIALLANSIATGGALIALIGTFGAISGAHFNPAVTLFVACREGTSWIGRGSVYVTAQVLGAITGVAVAHAMFGLEPVQVATHARASTGELIGEVVATSGLLLTIWGVGRTRPDAVPNSVAAYIVGAYWFTSSTSFANPAVTIARSLTDTFAGIAPVSAPAFVIAQIAGIALALASARILTVQDLSD